MKRRQRSKKLLKLAADAKVELKELRKAKGLTQVELATKTGLLQQMISAWESTQSATIIPDISEWRLLMWALK